MNQAQGTRFSHRVLGVYHAVTIQANTVESVRLADGTEDPTYTIFGRPNIHTYPFRCVLHMISMDIKPADYIAHYKAASAPVAGSVRAGTINTSPEMTEAIARAIWSKWDQGTDFTFEAVEQKEADTGTHRKTPRHHAEAKEERKNE